MGSTYTVTTFNTEDGRKDFAGFESFIAALWCAWKLKRTDYYGVVGIDWR